MKVTNLIPLKHEIETSSTSSNFLQYVLRGRILGLLTLQVLYVVVCPSFYKCSNLLQTGEGGIKVKFATVQLEGYWFLKKKRRKG